MYRFNEVIHPFKGWQENVSQGCGTDTSQLASVRRSFLTRTNLHLLLLLC